MSRQEAVSAIGFAESQSNVDLPRAATLASIAQAKATLYVGDEIGRLIDLLEGGGSVTRGDYGSTFGFDRAGRI